MERASAPAAAIRRAPQRPRISGTVSSTTSSRPRCHVESARMPVHRAHSAATARAAGGS